jgi:hypothetical protein
MKKLLFKLVFILLAALVIPVSAGWAASSSNIEVRVFGGMVSPVSEGVYQYFKADFSFGGSLGYKLDDQFSLLLDCQYNMLDFSPGGDTFDPVSNFKALEVTILEKIRMHSITRIDPYFFLGEGVAFASFSNPIWGGEPNEIDPMVEAGLGLEFAMVEQFSAFLQTKVSLIFTSDKVSPDSLTFYIPIQAGLGFSL